MSSGVEVGGAVTHVGVGAPRRRTREHRQHRRGPIECLDLGLLVDAQHDRGVGRVEVEPDDVADLVDEQRIGRQLEVLDAVRLEPERAPDPRDRGLVQPDLGRHRPRRPLRRTVLRRGLQRRHDHLLDDLVGDLAGLTRPRLIDQPVETLRREPGPPLTDRHRIAVELTGDLLIRRARRSSEHDPAPQCQRLPGRRAAHPPLQRLTLLIAQHDLSRRPATSSHQCLHRRRHRQQRDTHPKIPPN